MKILIPVEGENRKVYTRMGRAPFFAVYEDENFLELRENIHAKSHNEEPGGRHARHGGEGQGKRHRHTEGRLSAMEPYAKEEVEHHRRDLKNIADVDVVLSRAVGPNMKEALELLGLKVVKIRKALGESADEVVANYLREQKG